MDNISRMLKEECERTLREVADAEVGSEEAKWNLEKLNELHRLMMAESEFKTSLEMKERELLLKEAEAKDEKKDRKWKRALDIGAIAVPVLSSSYWMAKAMKFEETGTFTGRAAQWVRTHMNFFKK